MKLFSEFIDGMFFNLDQRSYWQAEHYGFNYQRFTAKLADNNTISGQVIIPNTAKPLADILFFHSAQFNYLFSLPMTAFLYKAGFRVTMFDYRGGGESRGKASMNNIKEDARAVFDWMKSAGYGKQGLVFFGQGVGADCALQLYKDVPHDVNGLILESVYNTKKGWLKEKWGPVIGDIAAACLNVTAIDPAEILPTVKVPCLIVQPELDTFCRKQQRLLVRQHAPKGAQILNIANCKYLYPFAGQYPQWEKKAVEFITKKCLKQR